MKESAHFWQHAQYIAGGLAALLWLIAFCIALYACWREDTRDGR